MNRRLQNTLNSRTEAADGTEAVGLVSCQLGSSYCPDSPWGALNPQARTATTTRKDVEFVTKIEEPKNGADETLGAVIRTMESSSDAVLICTSELDLPGPRIVYVNRAFVEMSG